jgi:hypothetical protein
MFGGFLFNEMTTTIALIIPMFSVYTTAILKYIVATQRRTSLGGSRVTKQYIIVSWLVPTGFCLYLIAIVLAKAFNVGFSSFEEFKGLLLAGQTIFGGYMGFLLSSMFEGVVRQR